MAKIYVSLPGLRQYKKIVVLSHPGVVYINLDAEEEANMTLIVRELAA